MRLLSRKLGEPARLGMDGERLRLLRGLDLREDDEDDDEEEESELEESESLEREDSLSELEESESLEREDSLSELELESDEEERLDDRRDFLLFRGPS